MLDISCLIELRCLLIEIRVWNVLIFQITLRASWVQDTIGWEKLTSSRDHFLVTVLQFCCVRADSWMMSSCLGPRVWRRTWSTAVPLSCPSLASVYPSSVCLVCRVLATVALSCLPPSSRDLPSDTHPPFPWPRSLQTDMHMWPWSYWCVLLVGHGPWSDCEFMTDSECINAQSIVYWLSPFTKLLPLFPVAMATVVYKPLLLW
jgi:hypothetical protein